MNRLSSSTICYCHDGFLASEEGDVFPLFTAAATKFFTSIYLWVVYDCCAIFVDDEVGKLELAKA